MAEGASLDLAQEETTVLLISMIGIVTQTEALLNFFPRHYKTILILVEFAFDIQ